MSSQPAANTQLQGSRLILARLIWVAVIILNLGLFVTAVPYEYQAHYAAAVQDFAPALERLHSTPEFYTVFRTAMDLFEVLAFTLLGILIARMKPDDWMVLLVSMASITFGTLFVPTLLYLTGVHPELLPWVGLVRSIGLTTSLLAFFYLFPDGRPIPRWTRPLSVVWVLICLAWLLFPQAPFNLVYLDSWYQNLPASFAVLLAWFTTGAIAQLYRFWRVSGPIQRQQTKWVVFGSIAGVVGFFGYYAPMLAIPALQQPTVERLLQVYFGIPVYHLLILLPPVFIGVAILRNHLWQIDLIVQRSLVYGTLTLMLSAVYLASVILLENIFSFFAGGVFEKSEMVIVLATLSIAVLFFPLRQRVQSWIDRRFFRQKYDRAQLVAAFGNDLRYEVDLQQVGDRLLHIVSETMQPEHVSLTLLDKKDG